MNPSFAGQETKYDVNLKLDDVPLRVWANTLIRIDSDPKKVMTYEAEYSHTARVPIVDNSSKPAVIIPRLGFGEYVIRTKASE